MSVYSRRQDFIDVRFCGHNSLLCYVYLYYKNIQDMIFRYQLCVLQCIIDIDIDMDPMCRMNIINIETLCFVEELNF